MLTFFHVIPKKDLILFLALLFLALALPLTVLLVKQRQDIRHDHTFLHRNRKRQSLFSGAGSARR